MKLFQFLLEIIGWLQIAIGVALGVGLMAFMIYVKWTTDTGKIVAIAVVSLGFILGCVLATRIWKKYGTINWLSRIRKIS